MPRLFSKTNSATLVIIILLPQLAAYQLEPKMVGSSEIKAQVAWSIAMDETPEGRVTARFFGLPSTNYQSTTFNANYEYVIETDSFDNQVLVFSLPPQKTSKVVLDAVVRVAYGEFDSADASDAALFLNASPLVELAPEVHKKALEISKRAASDEETLVLATAWVHAAVNYSLDYENVSKSALWVYEHRQGTCDEYSHLLLAVLRSLGIPARFVAGFVHTGKAFGPHAWVEALIEGKWVPADATYNEALILDGTHVKFAHGIDQNDVKEEVSALGGNNISLSRNASLSFTKIGNFSNLFDLRLLVPSYRVGEGSLELINATIESKSSKPVGVPLFLSAPNNTYVIDAERLVYLRPGEAKNETWKIVFPAYMEERYIYNFTFELSSLGEKTLAYVEGQKGGRQLLEESITIKDLYFRLDNRLDGKAFLTAVIQNSGSKAINADVILEIGENESQRTIQISPGDVKKLEFAFARPERNVSGELRIVFSGRTIAQPFELSVSLESVFPTPAGASPAVASPAALPAFIPSFAQDYEIKFVVDERFLATVAFAVIFIALAIILARKRSSHYRETK